MTDLKAKRPLPYDLLRPALPYLTENGRLRPWELTECSVEWRDSEKMYYLYANGLMMGKARVSHLPTVKRLARYYGRVKWHWK